MIFSFSFQGYWDLVTPEIVKIEKEFEKLLVLEKNKWVEEVPEPVKRMPVARRPAARKVPEGTKATLAQPRPINRLKAFLAAKSRAANGAVASPAPASSAVAINITAENEPGMFSLVDLPTPKSRVLLALN